MRERSAKEKVERGVELGRNAAVAGDPDFTVNDPRTSLTDTLTNLRHWADSAGVSWYGAMAMADAHFQAEVREFREETRQLVHEERREEEQHG